MKFCAALGVFLKLSRLFLRICKWVLLKMSINCKISGFFSGQVPVNFKLEKSKEPLRVSNGAWKWRAMLLLMWVLGVVIGCLLSSSSFSYGGSTRKEQTPNFCEEKGQILLEHLNVSMNKLQDLASLLSEKDQMAYLEYWKKLSFQMAPSNGIVCALKVQCVEKQEHEKQHIWVEEYGKPTGGQRKALEDQNADEKLLQARAVEGPVKGGWKSFSFRLLNGCCLVLLGMIAGCKIHSFYVNSWRNKKEMQIQEKLLAYPDKQLPQKTQKQETKGPSRRSMTWREKLLVVFVLAGCLSSIWLFSHFNEDMVMRREETLVNMCDERARMLQDQFNVSINHVHALAILVSTFHHGKQPSAIDQKTFEEYTQRTAFERPLTSGVAYALKVLHSEREQFEKLHGWTIKKMEIEDQTLVQDCSTENLDPSPVRDEYAPVILSQETVSHIVSIDMMSGKEDRENILRARASGKGVLTSPFKLLKSNHLGVVLTFAVYRTDLPPDATPEQRIEATMGYLGASYDVPSLVDKLLHQLASKQTIVVNVYDTTNESAPINMYGTEVIDTGLSHVSQLDFGDPSRKHEMHCRFKQKPPLPWTAITTSIGVLVITLLAGHIFYDAIKQIAKVEGDCNELRELKIRAEAADVAKSQFLATVSHEIRTPIHGVLGMLQLLMDTDLDANQLDFAQTAHNSGKDLISLINEVLDQAKIESGRLELEAVPFDLRGVLDNILSIFSGRSSEKGIELAVYVSEQVPPVVIGDPGRFRQIITNLVGNSIKFTHNRGHIFVSVHVADEVKDRLDVRDEVLRQGLNSDQDRSENTNNTLSGHPVVDRWESWRKFRKLNDTNSVEEQETIKLLITVEDTGIGIRHDAQSRIFRPFMQADSSTSREYGGTGIGLSISKRLVNLMGGEIDFVSEPGTGSTFSFTAAFGVGERSSLCTKRESFDPDVSEFRGLKALVVDGRKIRAQVTRYHLQRLGICADIVSSLKCACSYLSSSCNISTSTKLAMILIDEDMSDNDTDLAFQHQIQKLRPNGRIKAPDILPKIFLLVKSMNLSKHGGIKSTFADDVLSKPLRLSLLVACLQESHGFGKRRQFSRRKPSVLGNLLKQRRILVVDDNVVNQKVAEGALKTYEAIVTCVGSGRDALERLKPPHEFDACFMDLQMPEMDGFKATEYIRSMESEFNKKLESREASIEMSTDVAHWHTPILAMTADVIQATNEKCIECGMDGYVSKPFEEEQLYSSVARFFDSSL